MSVPIQITMVGQLPNAPYTIITWTVWNAPDNTGAQSGFGAFVLQNIGVSAVTAVGNPVNPLTLTVGGDLAGSLPNPSVSAIQGQPVSASPAPHGGAIMQFEGGQWVYQYGLIPQSVTTFTTNGSTCAITSSSGITPTITRAGLGYYQAVYPVGTTLGRGVANVEWTGMASNVLRVVSTQFSIYTTENGVAAEVVATPITLWAW